MSEDQTLSYDVVVIGGGAVGENAADRAARTGLSVLVVERELVGGECSYWACMPSKALLRPGSVLAQARAVPGAAELITGTLDPALVLARRDEFTSHWDDHGQVEWLESAGLALLRGSARFTGEKELLVEDEETGTSTRVIARHAVIVASGSEPVIPGIPGLAESQPWTSREATAVEQVPGRLVILGGGVVGVEMATAYRDLGAEVTLIVRGDRVLTGAEPFAAEEVGTALRDLGVDLRFGTETTAVRRDSGGVHLTVTGPQGESTLDADELVVATGRRPRTADLGLEVLGLDGLTVDDALQVPGHDWLFAVGDVTGRTATTHQGKYDARVAGDVVAARFGDDESLREQERAAGDWSRFRATADHAAVPQVVFTRPEVAWVGLTEQQARDAGRTVRAVSYPIGSVAGASVSADGYHGTAQIVVDEDAGVIVGATFTGPDAAELLQTATTAVVAGTPLDRLWHAVPAYPTVSEVWLRLLETTGL
ncbi:dihydrolipoyl dehydrogenase family protein [Cellulomonas denverensis]|uniref:NAD(P)/FAD-dependent oxidoreductase n=1 Tax=Cellulomonas denverensis TaxID=264297 RepID=A0A7X6KV72_9CELL|nr:NAD(P)/FAD-dependent oxidoreductase [Cellulomonas denverensis]NKY22695.1 NAD(P)/FAD-dependent oxidoreductase [Cellulomonas denverensis]